MSIDSDNNVVSTDGSILERAGAFAEIVVGRIKAGAVVTTQTITNSLSITTENVSVAGQSLRDYIVNVVNEAIGNNKITINNEQNTINNKQVTVDDNSKFEVLDSNTASGSAVASIDNSGNANLSGSLSVGSDATVSGTIRAKKIIADEIEGINIKAATVSAYYVTNNYYDSTDSFPTLTVTSGTDPKDFVVTKENAGIIGGIGNFFETFTGKVTTSLLDATNIAADNLI